ncbi:MAG: nonstructural protein [Microvirus sp.]|nr:MAG: nonstructural protein [Microvirus sp.]
MKQLLFALYDCVSNLFGAPFIHHNVASAKRHIINQFSGDKNVDASEYQLHLIGEINLLTGELIDTVNQVTLFTEVNENV